jgi:hypothetical protein
MLTIDTPTTPLEIQITEKKPMGIVEFLDQYRERVGLVAKGNYPPHFDLPNKDLEEIHILLVEFDNMFYELEKIS